MLRVVQSEWVNSQIARTASPDHIWACRWEEMVAKYDVWWLFHALAILPSRVAARPMRSCSFADCRRWGGVFSSISSPDSSQCKKDSMISGSVEMSASLFLSDSRPVWKAWRITGAGQQGTCRVVSTGWPHSGQFGVGQYPHLSIHLPTPNCPTAFLTVHIQKRGEACLEAHRIASQSTRSKA